MTGVPTHIPEVGATSIVSDPNLNPTEEVSNVIVGECFTDYTNVFEITRSQDPNFNKITLSKKDDVSDLLL